MTTFQSDLRCLYSSKPCYNVRDLKANGELHRLCEFHRSRAKEAQRRWHSRQRQSAAPYQRPQPSKPTPAKKEKRIVKRAPSADLTDEDIAQLSELVVHFHNVKTITEVDLTDRPTQKTDRYEPDEATPADFKAEL